MSNTSLKGFQSQKQQLKINSVNTFLNKVGHIQPNQIKSLIQNKVILLGQNNIYIRQISLPIKLTTYCLPLLNQSNRLIMHQRVSNHNHCLYQKPTIYKQVYSCEAWYKHQQIQTQRIIISELDSKNCDQTNQPGVDKQHVFICQFQFNKNLKKVRLQVKTQSQIRQFLINQIYYDNLYFHSIYFLLYFLLFLSQTIFSREYLFFIFMNVSDHIRGLDKFPATPHTYWGGIKNKKTILGGVIGLLFIIVTLLLVISKTIGVVNKQQLNLDSFVRRDMSPVAIGEEQILLVMLYVDQDQQIVYVLDPDQLPQFGVTARMIQYDADMIPNKQVKSQNITDVKMQRCKGKNREIFLCAYGLKYQPECSMGAIDIQVCHHLKQYHLLIMKCNQTEDPDCSPVVDPHLFPSLLIYDTKFNLYQLNNQNIFRTSPIFVNDFNGGVFIDPNQNYVYQVPVSKLVIQLQQSILPRSVPLFQNNNSTQKYFYPTQNIGLDPNYHTHYYDAFMQFYIHRSPYTEIYRRYYPRIDTMLGEVFGLMGLISIFLALFCQGYNSWLMDKHIKQQLNEHEPGRKAQSDTYFQYIKQKVKGLATPCCQKKQKQSFLQSQSLRSDQKQQKQSDVIDIIQMYKQMQKIKQQNVRKQQILNQMRTKIGKLSNKIQQLQQKKKAEYRSIKEE